MPLQDNSTNTDLLLKTVGDKIRFLRQSLELTQENVADALQMSSGGYAKIERGETDLSLTRLHQIADVLGVKASDILGEGKSFVVNVNDNGKVVSVNANVQINHDTSSDLKDMIITLIQQMNTLSVRIGTLESAKQP
ncbi:MAG: helix-turn-helix transcriptional regulator [Bacteroidia bacterium]|nr:helix-turn-helix transcriptional regulator [Bacteroidia bacterium]